MTLANRLFMGRDGNHFHCMTPSATPATKSSYRKGLALALGLLLFLLLTSPVSAQPPDGGVLAELIAQESDRPIFEGRRWRLTAAKLAADHDAEIVDAEGDVLVRSGDDYMRADFARYFHFSEWIYLRGNVQVRWDKYYFEAEEAEFDLRNRVGWMKRGRIITEDPSIFISGERIEKKGDLQYTFSDAEITACEDDPAAWSIKVSSAEIDQDSSATLWNPRLRLLDIPVLYLPWLAFPIVPDRESGLLFPDAGISSRDGATYLQPIYFALGQENDATLTEYYMSERGVLHDLEFRSTPDSATKLWLRGSWLNDKVTASSEAEEDDQFDDDGLVRPNEDRYWLRGMFTGYLVDPDWELKADLDYVSDQNYLREFKTRQVGYNHSRNTLRREFGRDIETADSLTRSSALLLSRQYDYYGLNLKTAYTQNLAYLNDNLDPDDNPTVQRLPEFSAFAYTASLGETPFEWDAQSSVVNFWRRSGTTGLRMDVLPRLSLPLTSRYGSVIPSIGWRQTVYAIDRYEALDSDSAEFGGFDGDQPTSGDSYVSRGLPYVSIASLSEASRAFELFSPPETTLDNAGESSWTKLRHTLQPRVSYTWIPDTDQDDLPYFDPVDRIERTSVLRYSLTNLFDRKRQAIELAPQEGNFYLPREVVDYRQFFRLRLEQYYDFNERNRTERLDEFPRRPFSDIEVEATIFPEEYISLSSSTFFSPYAGDITEHEHWLTLYYQDYARLFFGLDFLEDVNTYQRRNDERLRTATVGGSFHLPRDWILDARYQFDLLREEDVEKEVALTYRYHCFDFQVVYFDDNFEQSFTFRINLLGLSSPSLSI